MGHRALRIGDLVVPLSGVSMFMFGTATDVTKSSEPIGNFTFGIYLGGELTPSRAFRDRTITTACVLDSKTMKYGWVPGKFLRRAGER